MGLKGSKWPYLACTDCEAASPTFRVYLYVEDGEDVWDGTVPEGWQLGEESDLWVDGIIYALCPKCKKEESSGKGG